VSTSITAVTAPLDTPVSATAMPTTSVPTTSERDYSHRYDPDTHIDRIYTDATAKAIGEWIRVGDQMLELGCATGRMSSWFASAGAHVLGVDRSVTYLERARHRQLPHSEFVEGDLTAFASDRRFDHVVATNVLHEIDDPVAFLERCVAHLVPGGKVHVSLQNPSSIHRLIGLATGAITSLKQVSSEGSSLHTLELYDREDLIRLGAQVGLRCVAHRGLVLKPLPNSMMADLPQSILDGFEAVSDRLNDLCSMNYLVFALAARIR
jgi:2-polyprenyl-3-methyl-5-hydroxy-6-metoxy-1,4-benzoquinol methylase